MVIVSVEKLIEFLAIDLEFLFETIRLPTKNTSAPCPSHDIE